MPEASNTSSRNIHGRRPGRGVRPYLIVLKLVSVAMFAGGLTTVLIVVGTTRAPEDVIGWAVQASVMRLIYTRVVVPGLVAALLFGTLLAASMLRVMLRMRWFVVKMMLIAAAVPSLHLFMRSRAVLLHEALRRSPPDLPLAGSLRVQLLLGTSLALAFALSAIILGRVKPRLGQDYGRTFARKMTSA